MNLSEDQLETLTRYVKSLLEWNRKVNLLSRKDESNIWVSHILHSLCIVPHVGLPPGSRVLDLGSGGGLPGVPIAILRPDLQITLLDSVHKKVEALKEIVAGLRTTNVSVICGRAGEIRLKDVSSEGSDVVIARAVAPLRDLVRWSLTLVRRGAHAEPADAERSTPASFTTPFLVAMKGGPLEDELQTTRLRYSSKRVSTLDLAVKGVSDEELVDKKLVIVEL